MLTLLAFLTALAVTPAEEAAILQQVMGKYLLDVRSHPDASKSLFIARTMNEGALDTVSLRIPPSSPEQVDELAVSLEENNREAIALPELPASVALGDAGDLKTDGRYDWERIAHATGGAEAVVEVSRPAFTRDGKVAVVRVVIRQPKESAQELYFLKRTAAGWQMASFTGHRVQP